MKITLHIKQITVWILMLSCYNSVLGEIVIAETKSPDQNISLEILFEEDVLFYRILKQQELIIDNSKLGINTSLSDFSSGLTFESANIQSVDESYTLPSGKKSTYINKYNQVKAHFSKLGKNIEITFRVFDDGIAYRYVIQGEGQISISNESSECVIPYKNSIHSQAYSRSYKNPFEENSWSFLTCMNKPLSLPILVETGNHFVLISEAMVNGNYTGSTMSVNETSGAFMYQTNEQVSTSLPFKSPWRTMILGSLKTIVESTIIENLNDASTITDLSWIKPGRAAWSYGGEDTSEYLNLDNIKKYIDWSNEMGWEYFTLDKGWQNNRNFSLSQVINYANSKSTGVFIWVNQQMLPNNEFQLRNALINWKNQGVKGLKVDFWESDSQNTMKKYDLLLKLASEQKLLLIFHSCTKPSGLRRTWPHLLSTEAVSGNIYYARNPELISANHNINSAIIRNSLGSTDYAPVDFAEKNGRILQRTSWAHQLALSVIFESGIQHIMDAPGNLTNNIAKFFLETLPVAWDDTKCLEADLDKFISIARKKNDDWYLATLTNDSRIVEFPLAFLSPDKKYNAYIYKDGECPSEIKFEYIENLGRDDKLTLSLLNTGGAVVHLSTSNNHVKPLYIKYEAESEENIIPFGVPVRNDIDSLCSGGKYVASIGKGRSLIFQQVRVPKTGTYALTFYYMSDSFRTAFIQVNGKPESWQECSFINTGKVTGSGLAHKTIFVELEADIDNTIEFGNPVDYAPNLDRIYISPTTYDNDETNILPVKGMKNSATIFSKEKNIIIKHEADADYFIYNSLGQMLKAGSFYGKTSIPMSDHGVYIVKLRAHSFDFSGKVIIK